MGGSNDTSIRALAELLDELIFGVYDKGRVECSEAVSLHDSATASGGFGMTTPRAPRARN